MGTGPISVNLYSVAFLASWREAGTAILMDDLPGDKLGVRAVENALGRCMIFWQR